MKNTTLRFFSELCCPHYCCICGKLGSIICKCCKKDILLKRELRCLKCDLPILDKCPRCALPFNRQWSLGAWTFAWRGMIEEYKYYSTRAYALEFAELLAEIIPEVDRRTIVVPLPTIRKHIRVRGMDHMMLIAKRLAKMRGWGLENLLRRKNNTVQVGASQKMRKIQAVQAYEVKGAPDFNARYLMLDDVWTTGSSMCEAVKRLRSIGIRDIDVAILAKGGKRLNCSFATDGVDNKVYNCISKDGNNQTNDGVHDGVFSIGNFLTVSTRDDIAQTAPD